MRCSILFHFDVPGGSGRLGFAAGAVRESLQLIAPQAGAGVVGGAGVCGDRQRRGVGVTGLAQVLPPIDDRVDREGRGVAGDPDTDPALIGGQVIDAVGDRVPELLVLEVVPANLDRPAPGLKLAADRLEIADQLALLGIHADHRLTGRDRLADRLVDVLKLRVTIRVPGALARLLVRLQSPVPSFSGDAFVWIGSDLDPRS
jgi:hypothetical protein